MNPRRTLQVGLIFGVVLLASLIFAAPGEAQDCGDQQTLETGARLYAENCALCHGEDGQGRVGATLAKDWPSIRPDLRVRDTIVKGVPGSPMPAWSQANGGPLANEEIESLVCYILSWETGGPSLIYPTPTFRPSAQITAPPGVEGDPNQGAVLYQTNCAVCHGEKGEGRIGANLTRVFASIRPDLLAQSVITNGVEGSAMPAWSQANGGPLTDEEIRNITAYILTWSPAPAGTIPAATPGAVAGFPWWVWVLVILGFIALLAVIVLVSRRAKT